MKNKRISWGKFLNDIFNEIKDFLIYKLRKIRGQIRFDCTKLNIKNHSPLGNAGIIKKEIKMRIDFIYDSKKEELVKASRTDFIASNIVASYVFDLTPGGEILVATSVTNQELYNWIQRKGYSIFNRFFVSGKMDKIITEAMKQNKILQFGWTVEKGLRGKYVSLNDGQSADDFTWKIILNNTPIPVIEQIATALCREFRQESVLIHDLEKNTYKYWSA